MAALPHNAPPPLLDKVVRFLVWALVAGFLLAPIGLLFTISRGCSFGNESACSKDSFAVVSDRLIRSRAGGSGIIAGPDAATLRQDFERLRKLTGTFGDARRGRRALEVILLRFGSDAPMAAATRPGYLPMSLDIAGLNYRGVVVISDSPVVWSIVTNGTSQRGFVALEGPAPFDIDGGYPGVIAGFKSEAFGAVETARSSDYGIEAGDGTNRSRLCRALEQWAGHFSVALAAIDITVIEDATAITVADRRTSSDGTTANTDSAAIYCRMH